MLLFLACVPAGPTWYADVQPIVAGRCVSCHAAGQIGGFSLAGYDEVVARGAAVRDQVEARTMPPWGAEPGHRAYLGDPSLDDEQIATVTAWVDAGMPEGSAKVLGEPLPPVGFSLPRTDGALALPEPYSPVVEPDDYRCFPVAWAATDTVFVTGFEVHPGNTSVVHHVAAYLIRPDGLGGDGVADTFYGWDEAEAGPGYTCFGGPSKTGEELDFPIQQVAQWVPGNGAVVFPDGAGIEIPAGSLVVLQVHYNTDGWDGAPDETSLDLMLEDDVPRLGAFAPWLDATWTFGEMEIPPGGDEISYVAEGDPLWFFSMLLGDSIDLSAGFDIHAAMLHMHTLGVSGEVRVDKVDGTAEELLEVKDWDFDWQFNYQFLEPVPFAKGDSMYLRCTFANPGEEPVTWGEGTGDEMCVGNLFVSVPR